jgi:hypothetical protein
MKGTQRVLRLYREQKLTDRLQLVLAKKVVELDHLAIDVTGLVGPALRMSKNVTTEQRRNKEVARHVTASLHQLIKRFQPRKSLALFMDGPEPLWKADKTRSSTITKRIESRLMRLPGTSLMQSVEEKVARMAPDNRLFPAEVVFCGTGCEGPVEQKMSAWALDVASRDSCKGNTSVAMLGAGELLLNTWGLTPFYNLSNVVQNGSDFKQLRAQDILEWLGLDKKLLDGDIPGVARMRTDLLFLYCLAHGASATELPAITLLSFADLADAYHAAQKTSPTSYLFESSGNSLVLDVAMLEQILAFGSRKGSVSGRIEEPAADFLELALQSHALLCHGWVPNVWFVPRFPGAPQTQSFLSHLRCLVTSGKTKIQATTSSQLPLTACEFTALSLSIPSSLETFIQQVTGQTIRQEVAKSITGSHITSAAVELRSALRCSPRQHKSLFRSPAYCWMQSEKSKLWSFHYVDIGVINKQAETRSKKGESQAADVSFSVAADGPATYNPTTSAWEPIATWPVGGGELLSTLTVATWNVMFDRYSGKPTPLGMPGIDWCTPQRYPVISRVLQRTGADVIAMQEVEPQFWEFLSKQDWVKEGYSFSCGVNGASITPWGVLMLVSKRARLMSCTHINVPAWSSHVCLMPVVAIQMAHAVVHVAGVHLLAPFTKNHENARTAQDTVLRQKMQKAIVGECITVGDYNDWPMSEFTMPPDSQYVDAWPIVNPKLPGKTMDESNEFCKLKIEEEFFGRSDKMFLRSRKLVPVYGDLIGTKSVNEENGNNKAPGYLFPSDHFGVVMKFALKHS